MTRRTVVKVCGLTRREDAAYALACGADWLGFVVHGGSPRRVDPEQAARIVEAVGGGIAVAVMVGVTPEQALDIARRSRADRIQLHRVAPQTWPAGFPLPCSFAMGVTPEGEMVGEEPGPQHLVLLDTAYGNQAGGTGRTWPWDVARGLTARRDVMLAGGLSGENVAQAILTLQPFGVDASSALELSPGIKDPEKVRRYVAAARDPELNPKDAL